MSTDVVAPTVPKRKFVIPIIYCTSGWIEVEATTRREAKQVANSRQWLESDINDPEPRYELMFSEMSHAE